MVAADDLLAGVRQRCLALPEVTERLSHGSPTWFVRGKRSFVMFVGRHHRDPHIAFWAAAPAGAQHEMVAAEPARFFVPPYVGPSGWLGMRLDAEPDGLDWEEVREVITDAYRHVAPKTLLAKLDATSPP